MEVYSDDICVVHVNENPITLGHVRIYPKKEVQYLDLLPGAQIAHMYSLANTCAQILFEGLKCDATNIICRNGIDSHVSLEIIARKNEDGLGMIWEPTPADRNTVAEIASKIKAAIIPVDPKQVDDVVAEPVPEEIYPSEPEQKEDEQIDPWNPKKDYRLDALKRLP